MWQPCLIILANVITDPPTNRIVRVATSWVAYISDEAKKSLSVLLRT